MSRAARSSPLSHRRWSSSSQWISEPSARYGCPREVPDRLVDARRVLAERVAVDSEGPRPRPAAQVGVLAPPAPSLERGPADLAEHLVVAVDLAQGTLAQVPEPERQEPCRVDLAVVRDEQDALAVPRRGRVRARLAGRRAELVAQTRGERAVRGGLGSVAASAPCGDHAAEERCLDGPDDELVGGRVEEEVAHVLVLGGGDRVRGDAAADVDEEEDLPDVRPGALHERGDIGEFLEVLTHDGRVDLDVEPRGDERPDGRDGVVEVVLDRADALMGRRGRAVEADGDRPDAARRDALDHLRGQRGGHRGGQRHRDPEVLGVLDELEQVGAQQAVAAREDEDRVRTSEARYLVDEVASLGDVELARERLRQGGSPAVPARDAARPRGLPEDEHGALGEVHLRHGHAGVAVAVSVAVWSVGRGDGHADPLVGVLGLASPVSTSSAVRRAWPTHEATPTPVQAAPMTCMPGVAPSAREIRSSRPWWPTVYCGMARGQRWTWASTGAALIPMVRTRSAWTRATSSSSSMSMNRRSPYLPTIARSRTVDGSARCGHLVASQLQPTSSRSSSAGTRNPVPSSSRVSASRGYSSVMDAAST